MMAEAITGRFTEPLDPDKQVDYLGGEVLKWIRRIRYSRKSGCHRLEVHCKDGNITFVQTLEASEIVMPGARARK